MIKTHSTYIAYLQNLAEKHIEIKHNNPDSHFARIMLDSNPFVGGHMQIAEFINSMRTKLKPPFVLAIGYSATYKDMRADNPVKKLECAFIIMDKVRLDDHDSEEEVYDRTERIGDEFLGYILEDYCENEEYGFVEINEMDNEKIAKVTADNYFGTKFNFTIKVNVYDQLEFKPAQFGM